MPGRAPSPGEEEAELRQRIAAAREERDALLQLRHERAERLRAEAELEMARTRSAEKTAQLAASQTKLAQLKRAVSPDVALDADGAAEGLEGAPEEVQLIAAVADTIQVYRRCVAATVVPVFPQSMTLERHELATIFGSPAGYGLSDTAKWRQESGSYATAGGAQTGGGGVTRPTRSLRGECVAIGTKGTLLARHSSACRIGNKISAPMAKWSLGHWRFGMRGKLAAAPASPLCAPPYGILSVRTNLAAPPSHR
eukprot:COSAG06_NODE_6380_length_2957_cov_2.445066_3_plen_254_part_00